MLLTDFTDYAPDPQNRLFRILFVCHSNMNRSKTFENYFKKNFPRLDVKSCGTYEGVGTTISESLLEWANQVFVMDISQAKIIHECFEEHYGKVKIVGVSDQYDPGDPDLLALIKFWIDVYEPV